MTRWMMTVAVVTALGVGCATTGEQAEDIPKDPPTPAVAPATPQTPATPEPAEPLQNTLKWTTASEVENFGFDIYRATSEDGPFERMTDEPLPGAGTVDEPQRYIWIDNDIDPGRDYWYYIESISIDNIRERFSPIILAPAKSPGVAAGDDGDDEADGD